MAEHSEDGATAGQPPSDAIELINVIAQDSVESFILIDANSKMHIINGGRPIAALFDESPEHIIKNATKYVAPADHQLVRDCYAAAMFSPGALERVRFSVLVKGGGTVVLRATLINRLEDPAIRAMVVRVGLAEEQQVAYAISGTEEVVEESWPSGRLPNKEAFMKHLERVVALKDKKIWQLERVARAVVRDRRYDYSLILLELDRFKMLLGGFGRDILDELVEQVIKRITAMLRGKDVVAHFGGGEFAILLHRVGMAEHATSVADAVLDRIEMRFEVSGQPISVAPVIGIATSERRYQNADEVVRDATAAASRAFRRRGRRREAFKTRIRIEDKKRIGLMADMHESLGTEAFSLVYQPIVQLSNDELVGFEALLRWQHPQLGAISPVTFIPLAEESGLIRQLGRWVLERACSDMAVWNAALTADNPLMISVNVSPLQLGDDQLVGEVETVLADTKLSADQLRLEITESAVLDNLENVTDVIGRLKKQGVTFSLDDFGTGYSSLSYLRLLPYDSLKIDRMFLRPRNDSVDGGDMAIVRAVISMSKGLGLNVVAEGVETAEQAQMLRDLDCEYGQGYLFSKPLDRRRAAELIVNGNEW